MSTIPRTTDNSTAGKHSKGAEILKRTEHIKVLIKALKRKKERLQQQKATADALRDVAHMKQMGLNPDDPDDVDPNNHVSFNVDVEVTHNGRPRYELKVILNEPDSEIPFCVYVNESQWQVDEGPDRDVICAFFHTLREGEWTFDPNPVDPGLVEMYYTTPITAPLSPELNEAILRLK